jgi:hypothetical protein
VQILSVSEAKIRPGLYTESRKAAGLSSSLERGVVALSVILTP